MVRIGNRIVMLANDCYWHSVEGTTGTVIGVAGNDVDVYFDAPLNTDYTVDARYVKVIQESTMFDHDTARQGKIGAIKALRAFVPNLSLKEAKDIVESIGTAFDTSAVRDVLQKRVSNLTTEIDIVRAANSQLKKDYEETRRAYEKMRDAYNDLLSYVPTDRLIDLLRK